MSSLRRSAAGVEDLQHCPVPQPQGLGYVGGDKQSGHLRCAQGGLGQRAVGPRHEEIGGGVGRDPALTAQPREELGDGHQALGLGGERQRLAVALAVQEQRCW